MEYTRFEQLLRSHGATMYQVSKATGIAASTFSDWKSGRSAPKAEKLTRIAAFFSMSLDEMLGTPSGKREAEHSYRSLRASKMVPVVGELHPGMPIVNQQTTIGLEFADVDDAAGYFYLPAADDSMRDHGMVRGSLVLFRKQQHADAGNIVACLVEGSYAVVRQYVRQGRRVLLTADRPDIPAVFLSPEDFEIGRARVLGVAVEVKTRL